MAVAAFWFTETAAADDTRIVEISSGHIAGDSIGNVDRFMGVPYAAPPVGELRWRAPQAVQAWSGVRSARAVASACAQYGNFFASADDTTFDKPYGSEDCLYLNVWAPKTADKARPVLVFFHGGSGFAGNAAHPFYDGAQLAEQLDAVVITTNYRLGVFGSLQSTALHTGDALEASGNFYLLDLIRVLDWTKENCRSFGCDGSNITIAGHSAGAVIVLALLRSPLAKGKFHKAISLSGVPFSGSMTVAYERTTKLLTSLLIRDGSAADQKEAEKLLLKKSPVALREYLYRQPMQVLVEASGRGLTPVAVSDGAVLQKLENPDKPAPVAVSQVPLLIGKTRNELSTLIPLFGPAAKMADMWPYYSGETVQRSPGNKMGWFDRLKRRAAVAFVGRYLNWKFDDFVGQYAAQLPAVFVYQFEWDNYPEPWRSDLGAAHGLDVPFIFGNFIDDQEIYMRFAWTTANREEREALHRNMAGSLRAFLRFDSSAEPHRLDEAWRSWKDSSYIRVWGGAAAR
ncbi:MAG: carboxylesterase family protein [Alphaproteobacteria bacterium]